MPTEILPDWAGVFFVSCEEELLADEVAAVLDACPWLSADEVLAELTAPAAPPGELPAPPKPKKPKKRSKLQQLDQMQQLRHRAVLYEGEKSDEQFARSQRSKGRKHQPITLTPEEEKTCPALAWYLPLHGGWPPKITRDGKPRERRLRQMRETFGPLVMLTANLPHLDLLPLYSPELADAVRAELPTWCKRLMLREDVHETAIQRGGMMACIHVHRAFPLAHLRAKHRKAVWEAPHGEGGGCELLPGVHAVVIADGEHDLAKVAAYLSRHADGRLDELGTPAYLDALEDEVRRSLAGSPTAHMTWHANRGKPE